MRVSVVRSGGVAGMRRSATLDTDSLDPKQAEDLRRLVLDANLPDLGEPTISTAADRFHYTLTVEDGARRESVMFPEERVPERLRELFELLWRESKPDPAPPGTQRA